MLIAGVIGHKVHHNPQASLLGKAILGLGLASLLCPSLFIVFVLISVPVLRPDVSLTLAAEDRASKSSMVPNIGSTST